MSEASNYNVYHDVDIPPLCCLKNRGKEREGEGSGEEGRRGDGRGGEKMWATDGLKFSPSSATS